MKIGTVVMMSTMIAAMSATAANAQKRPNGQPNPQMQEQQQACEADVYALCGEYIPDADRITACLRAHWKDVSQECRKVMASYGRNHNSRRGHE